MEALKFDEDFFISTRNLTDSFLGVEVSINQLKQLKGRSIYHQRTLKNLNGVNDAAKYIAKQRIFCVLSYPRQIPYISHRCFVDMSDARCIHQKRFRKDCTWPIRTFLTLSPPSLPLKTIFSCVGRWRKKNCYTYTCAIVTASLVAILYLQVQSFSAVKQHLLLSESILFTVVYFKEFNWIVKYFEKGFNETNFHVVGLKTRSFAFTCSS